MTDKELVRQLRTKSQYKSAIQIAVEDSGLADRVIILGQGVYPNFAGLADMITALQNQAADRIEALSAENKRLREALVIKPLQWSDELIAYPFPYQILSDNGGSGAPDDPYVKFENYRVFEPFAVRSIGQNGDGSDQFDTIESAKIAAQNHYEKFIRAALGGE